jgi:hypothetical protein
MNKKLGFIITNLVVGEKINDPDDLASKISLALDNYPKITNKYTDKFKSNKIIQQYLEL